ncbi:MAG: acyl--CoA ligase [Alphaproteobacteria bacterium]|nr:acyl--CoA ligase [Alphaproteobacteria bacterium]
MTTRPTTYRPVTIFDGVFAAAARFPSKVAIIDGERRLPYRALAERARRVAAGAHARVGGVRGHTAMMLPNCLELMEIIGGLATAGLPPATINHQSTARELAHICNNAGARLLFAHVDQEAVVREATLDTVEEIILVGGNYEDWLSRAQPVDRSYGIEEWDTFALHYTSGTTGAPKGALVPHRSRVHVMFGMASEYQCFGPEDRGLAVCPLTTGGGFTFGLAPIFFGGTLVVMPRFDAEQALRLIEAERITNINIVPTHADRFLRLGEAPFRRYDRRSLKVMVSGGAAFPIELKEKTIALFGPDVLHELYGSTEGGIFTNLRPADQRRKPNSVGQLFPMIEARYLDESGNDVAPGEAGDFFSRSPYHFNGYWKNPEATRELFRGEWITVGDVAYADEEGYVHIVGRRKDMIISGGANVYPAEIEQVLTAHPLVAEAAIVGVPDPQWGEAVRAFVALKPGAALTAEDLAQHCRRMLSGYKVPKSFRFLDKLPRDRAMGKIQRKLLREQP